MEESILKLKKVAELREIAKAYGIDGCDKMKKKGREGNGRADKAYGALSSAGAF